MLSVQRALLGEVSSAMRAVLVEFDETRVEITFVFDGEISEEDTESASCVETEVIADMREDSVVTARCLRIDAPGEIKLPGERVFARREL